MSRNRFRNLKINLFFPNPFVHIFINVFLTFLSFIHVKLRSTTSNICSRKKKKNKIYNDYMEILLPEINVNERLLKKKV
jgi:hypothetical protein